MEAERHSVRVEKVLTKRKADEHAEPSERKQTDREFKVFTKTYTLTSANLMKFH